MFEFLTNLVGKKVVFHGYDGKDHVAEVLKVEAGCVHIKYSVPGIEKPIVAYICEPDRIDLQEGVAA